MIEKMRFILLIAITLMSASMGCENGNEPDYYTELGIPVYIDGDFTPDLEYTDAVYIAVCDCVNVDHDDYIGDFEVEITDDDNIKGRYSGWYNLLNSDIEVLQDQGSLAHELGHFFTDILIGYDKIAPHSPNTYEVLCENVLKVEDVNH